MFRKIGLFIGFLFIAVVIAVFFIPEKITIPVKAATPKSWNKDSFWHEPWGLSGVHKGIDIFARDATPVIAATNGIVIYDGNFGIGGSVLVVLGPKWRIHYYAHLKKSHVSIGKIIRTGEVIAEVGNTGNAKNKKPHLHYSLISLFPYVWLWDGSTQGWKKIFYLDPSKYLQQKRK